MTPRQIGQRFLALARQTITVVHTQDYSNTPADESVVIIRQLTPNNQLHSEFPTKIAGTPYAYFADTDDPPAPVVVVINQDITTELTDSIVEEAALGLMDNLRFR